MIKHLPNALTLLRLILAPMVALLFLQGFAVGMIGPGPSSSLDTIHREVAANLTFAAAFFVVAALTDLFDGMAARAFNAHSKLGRIIDPIADKALVGLPLIAIALIVSISWPALVAGSGSPTGELTAIAIVASTGIIVVRDVTMTIVRLASADGEGARVSSLAKWKTALELLVIGSMLVLSAIQAHMPRLFADRFWGNFLPVWAIALVITAALSAYTALQYLRPKR